MTEYRLMTVEEIWESVKRLGTAELAVVEIALADATHQFAPQVRAAAKQAVLNAAQLAISGDEKNKVAFEEIGSTLAAQGIIVGVQVAVSMIKRAIEVAYEWFMTDLLDGALDEAELSIPGAPLTGLPIGTM